MSASDGGVLALFRALAETPSPAGRERRVADAVLDHLRALGLDPHEDGAGGEASDSAGNLFVSIPGTVPGDPVLLCAHLDTVEPGTVVRTEVVDGIVRAAEGHVLGADDKVAVAAILDGVRRVLEGKHDHAGIELLFTVREELGLEGATCFDTGTLRATRGYLFDMFGPLGGLIVSAPSYRSVRLEFRGRAAHASTPESGANAIVAAAAALSRFPPGRIDEATTFNIGTIRGGSAANVVAETAHVDLEVRGRDDARAEALTAQLVAIARRAATEHGCAVTAEVETLYRAYSHDESSPALRQGERAVRAVGRVPQHLAANGGSDANVLNAAGLPCVNIASGMQEIHTAAEWIAVDDLRTLSDLAVLLITDDGSRR